jgi:ubiquinone/menaquinone biosynthesis C-methylase UbiE
MTNPPELKPFDRVAQIYDETRSMPTEAMRDVIAAMLEAIPREGQAPRLLEVGIGTGRIAVPLAAAGIRVTGIDISPQMLAVLRGKRRDIDVAFAEAARLPFRDGAFDAALFVHILHLVPDMRATLAATYGLVRPGGVLIEGGDDRAHGVRGDADDVIRDAGREVLGIDLWPKDSYEAASDTFREAGEALGADVARRVVARWTSSTTAARVIERLANRVFSAAWQIPDHAMPAMLAYVEPRVIALFGSRDGEVSFERSFSISVARLPEG